MPTVLDRLPHPARIAVIRLRSLGDCVLTTPSLELLRQTLPDSQVAVVVEDRFAPIFEGHPTVSAVLPPDWKALRRWRPQLTLNLHGGSRSMWLTALSGASFRAGFAHHRHAFVYNLRIPRAQQILGEERVVHTAEHLASALFWLGVPRREIPRATVPAAPAPCPDPPYAVIHPFASAGPKTWPPEHFHSVADYLSASGLQPVFIGAATDDFTPFIPYPRLPGLPLKQLAGLLQNAVLFLGNDSGPAHLAAASGLPVVVLFGDSDPVIWGPWRTPHRILTHPDGLSSLPATRVIEAVESLRKVMA